MKTLKGSKPHYLIYQVRQYLAKKGDIFHQSTQVCFYQVNILRYVWILRVGSCSIEKINYK